MRRHRALAPLFICSFATIGSGWACGVAGTPKTEWPQSPEPPRSAQGAPAFKDLLTAPSVEANDSGDAALDVPQAVGPQATPSILEMLRAIPSGGADAAR